MVATVLPHRMQEITPEEPVEMEEEANEVCTEFLGVTSSSKGGPASIEIDGIEEPAHKGIEVEVETSMMVSGRPGEFTDTQGEDKSLGSTKRQQRLSVDETESFKKSPMGFPLQ